MVCVRVMCRSDGGWVEDARRGGGADFERGVQKKTLQKCHMKCMDTILLRNSKSKLKICAFIQTYVRTTYILYLSTSLLRPPANSLILAVKTKELQNTNEYTSPMN